MDLSKTMPCPKCGNVVMVTDQFCSQCGERLGRPSFWRRVGAWLRSAARPGPHTFVIRKGVTLKTIDRHSVKHVYHSLDEVPPEFRATIEKLKKELDDKSNSSADSKDKLEQGMVLREDIQEFKFKDAAGNEQVYHSLDEMPPETRALFEKLRGRLGG